jgi:hypothetical protein
MRDDLTERGRRIAAYIVAAELPDGGRGFSVLGAVIDARTGHAFESRCSLSCPPRGCPEHGPPIDHGRVTEPGRIERFNVPNGEGPVDVGEEVTWSYFGTPAVGVVVQKRRGFLVGTSTLLVLKDGDCSLHQFAFYPASFKRTGTRRSVDDVRARYVAHLSQFPAWRAQLAAGHGPDW